MGEMPAIEDAGLSFWVQVFRLRFCIQELGVRVLGVLRSRCQNWKLLLVVRTKRHCFIDSACLSTFFRSDDEVEETGADNDDVGGEDDDVDRRGRHDDEDSLDWRSSRKTSGMSMVMTRTMQVRMGMGDYYDTGGHGVYSGDDEKLMLALVFISL